MIWYVLNTILHVISYYNIIYTFHMTNMDKSNMSPSLYDFTGDFTCIWNHMCWLWNPMWVHMFLTTCHWLPGPVQIRNMASSRAALIKEAPIKSGDDPKMKGACQENLLSVGGKRNAPKDGEDLHAVQQSWKRITDARSNQTCWPAYRDLSISTRRYCYCLNVFFRGNFLRVLIVLAACVCACVHVWARVTLRVCVCVCL